VAGLLRGTNARRSSIETVLHQFLHDGAQIDNDLAGLDLMNLQIVKDVPNPFEVVLAYRPALYGFYGGHGMVA
jgi:hypothetical protein